MNRKMVYTVIILGLLLMVLGEMLFSNLGTLLNEQARTDLATRFGLTQPAYTSRLLILAGLDLIAALGLVLVLRRMTLGGWVALVGFVGYAVYQIGAALTILPDDFRVPVLSAAVFYGLCGLLAYWIAPRMSKA
jgi:hypothetical protein